MFNPTQTIQQIALAILSPSPFAIDTPVEGWVVSADGQLGRVIRAGAYSVEVEYPAESNGEVYWVVGDVWFDHRPAMESDAALYDALWDVASQL